MRVKLFSVLAFAAFVLAQKPTTAGDANDADTTPPTVPGAGATTFGSLVADLSAQLPLCITTSLSQITAECDVTDITCVCSSTVLQATISRARKACSADDLAALQTICASPPPSSVASIVPSSTAAAAPIFLPTPVSAGIPSCGIPSFTLYFKATLYQVPSRRSSPASLSESLSSPASDWTHTATIGATATAAIVSQLSSCRDLEHH
ncbi:hypothetical protein NP233_g12359 [Leucocoprinus birnbaumii]|uniref:Extracellular membrane protein CFEM domain-containing protein n=1 Tax=Leucocoprinus birnbaumii TaxID=56174 RepID=A0AAD5YJI4_9AGAR|nr:hypothetical protein NP233_g12359 [Leucocoprinus birnbaumii]